MRTGVKRKRRQRVWFRTRHKMACLARPVCLLGGVWPLSGSSGRTPLSADPQENRRPHDITSLQDSMGLMPDAPPDAQCGGPPCCAPTGGRKNGLLGHSLMTTYFHQRPGGPGPTSPPHSPSLLCPSLLLPVINPHELPCGGRLRGEARGPSPTPESRGGPVSSRGRLWEVTEAVTPGP